ncbi:uncharacterized protein I303_106805 [Kwoniella dejecticola CBS 10117]|uniref:GH16 domain-containing protein n=1 Tax=Kwoniella dejecticola CBS 10117 TaxID=1296121 RepID=A0A1A5ZTM5_9TREE|nr:uncharacterized protein I303_08552 [Kwoniella dejecticola CBS 10117]OBR81168.1 hypothetical protein I303_08552 [Kwoniella dejecticola CBS 10117]
MRSTTLSLLSILPLMGRALAGTCQAKSGSASATGTGVIGVAAVATDGGASAVSATTEAPSASASASVPGPADAPAPIGPDTTYVPPGEQSTVITSGDSSAPASASASASAPVASSSAAAGGNTTSSSSGSSNPDDPTISYGSHPTFELKQPDKEECGCGYKVSGLDDIWMPFKFQFNFSDIGDAGPFSGPDDLKEYGWRINQGHHVGGPSSNGSEYDAATGTTTEVPIYQCLGDPSSLSVQGGELVMTVKGGQTPSGSMQCPELIHDNATLYGVFQADIQFSDVPGTCQAFWLNHTIADKYSDELDLEVLGGAINSPNENQPIAGLWSTNWATDEDPSQPLLLNHTTGLGEQKKEPTPFPNDPTTSFNSYVIAWVPGEYSPRYYNGQEIMSPSQYNAIHPQEATLNNWSNNNKWWSGEVPQTDSVMKVRSVLFYYRTEEVQTLPAGCKAEDVCTV